MGPGFYSQTWYVWCFWSINFILNVQLFFIFEQTSSNGFLGHKCFYCQTNQKAGLWVRMILHLSQPQCYFLFRIRNICALKLFAPFKLFMKHRRPFPAKLKFTKQDSCSNLLISFIKNFLFLVECLLKFLLCYRNSKNVQFLVSYL